MTHNSLKELAILLVGFVDRTIVPLIDPTTSERKRVLEQWTKLKTFVNENEGLEIWKMNNYLTELSTPNHNGDHSWLSYETLEKCQPNHTYPGLLDEPIRKYRPT